MQITLLLFLSICLLLLLALSNWDARHRREQSREYYERLFERMLENARGSFLRLPDSAPDGGMSWQIEWVERRVAKVRDASTQLGLVIDSRLYGRLLAEFTEAADELLWAIETLLTLIAMLAPEADLLQAAKHTRTKVDTFRQAADALLEQFLK
jgi:hypothetical protein